MYKTNSPFVRNVLKMFFLSFFYCGSCHFVFAAFALKKVFLLSLTPPYVIQSFFVWFLTFLSCFHTC